MKIKIMKKFYLVLLVLGMFVGFLSSCDDDDKYKPDALELEIVSKSGVFTVAKEDTLFLKAKLNNPQEVKFTLTLDGQEVSTDSVYMFIAANMGNYKIDVKATDGGEETTVSVSIEVYGKYKYGTFILNEGQVWKGHYGTLVFISPKGIVTDSVYFKENGGSLGGGTQDLYIRNNKLYIISQNGGNDGGFLTIANAETLKKESSYEDELGSTLSMPSHIAVLDDNDIYIRDNNGVYRFNPSSKVLTFIEGSAGANKTTMAVANGKIFAAQSNKLIVIESNKSSISKEIPVSGNISGVIPSSDGNIWLACRASGEEPAKIIKLDAQSYSMQENSIEDETAGKILNGGWNATPYITAKGDTLYMGSGSTPMPVYRHVFSQKKTEFMGDMTERLDHVLTLYNCIAVHPITGEVYANIISSYSLDPENKICVFDFNNDKLALKANYKGYTECPAGVFFTYNFE